MSGLTYVKSDICQRYRARESRIRAPESGNAEYSGTDRAACHHFVA